MPASENEVRSGDTNATTAVVGVNTFNGVVYFMGGGGAPPVELTPPRNIPPAPTNRIERGPLIAKIRTTLLKNHGTASVCQAVAHSGGGFGKSVAAILYAHAHMSEYPGGSLWVDCEAIRPDGTPETPGVALTRLAGGLAAHAAALKLTEADGAAAATLRGFDGTDKQFAMACAVASRLESLQTDKNSPTTALLVLDNLTDERHWIFPAFKKLLPTKNVHILITTRQEKLAACPGIPVHKLEPEESADLLAKYREDAGQPANVEAAARLADHVEHIAVYVAAIGATMKNTPEATWPGYWKDVATSPTEAIPAGDGIISAEIGYERHLTRILDNAIDALPSPERRAMRYAALLPPNGVPAFWLTTLLEQDKSVTLAKTKGVPISPAQAVLEHLIRLDMLRGGTGAAEMISPHRVHAARLRERLSMDVAQRDPLVDEIAACAAARRTAIIGTRPDGKDRGMNDPAALTDGGLRWELRPLADMCAHLWSGGQPGAAARIGVWMAPVLRQLGRYTEAAACLSPLAEHEAAVEAVIGPKDLATCYSHLALIQKYQGDLPAARASMDRAIAIEQKHFGDPYHPTFAASYSNLAAIQRDQGDLAAARANMERAISIQQAYFLAPNQLATSYSNLATIQRDQGDLPAARANMERAIVIQQKHFAPDHPTLATSYSNLALIQRDQGDLPAARASMERALAIEQKHFAPDHPVFGIRYSNLAAIQKDQGDLPAARASIERAIAIQEKHFAHDHPTFATSYNNLAHICLAEGDHAAACANFKRALLIFLKHFDENHPSVKTVRESMKAAGCGSEK